MTDLHDVPDEELAAEMQRRAKERREAEERARMEREARWFSQIEVMLQLVPNHTRTTCSDTNTRNGTDNNLWGYRCVRCVLLEAKEAGVWPTGYVPDFSLRRGS